MNKEIKEILELYENDDIEYYNLCETLGYDKFLDYITNLEQEKISESLSYDLAVAKVKELENRIDKAIEVLKNTMYPDIAKDKALNILTGGDEE